MFAYEWQHIKLSYIQNALHVGVVGAFLLLVKIHKMLEFNYENVAKDQKKTFDRPVKLLKCFHVCTQYVFLTLGSTSSCNSASIWSQAFSWPWFLNTKLGKEDFRRWTTLFKTLLLSCRALHDMQCNPLQLICWMSFTQCGSSPGTDSSLCLFPIKLPWVLESALLLMEHSKNSQCLWQWCSVMEPQCGWHEWTTWTSFSQQYPQLTDLCDQPE